MITINDFRIRKVDVGDVEFTIELRSDMEVNSMLGTFLFVNYQSQLKWIESLEKKSDSMYFIFEHKNGEIWQKVGIVRIDHIDFINKTASVGGDIIKEFRGKGFAKEMFRLILDLCFNYLNLNRAWLLVLENNNIAIDLYNKIGFVKEGVQRQAVFRSGKYLDYIMMSILKREYLDG